MQGRQLVAHRWNALDSQRRAMRPARGSDFQPKRVSATAKQRTYTGPGADVHTEVAEIVGIA